MKGETLSATALEERVDELSRAEADVAISAVEGVVRRLLELLEAGEVRAADPIDGEWVVRPWVKRGILLGFRHSPLCRFGGGAAIDFEDKAWFAPRPVADLDEVRLVPGGSAIRRGAFVAPGTVLMPPCYVNVGAFVGAGSMIDSHALVGSCAQVGEGVHLSAGAQIGGVLEPPGAMPVIVEDGAFVGGLSALFEGVRVGAGAVIGAGVVLTASTPLYDLQRERVITRDDGGVLRVPQRAVVIAGSRTARNEWAAARGVSTAAALIVKRRDAGTDARAALESALR